MSSMWQGTTTNFLVQYDPAAFQGNLPTVQLSAQALLTGCEWDYSILCGWFALPVGYGFGSNNRVVITLDPSIRGASNDGKSMTINGLRTPEQVMGLFVNEMIEILMRQKGNWDPSNSTGEGLSRVAGELLHPSTAGDTVNAWLAADPTTDPTATLADTEFRNDWVSVNFTGANDKSGNYIHGDWDTYSIGCAMLFIYYLHSQLNFSMPAIVQNGATTLAGTYSNLTNGRTDAFSGFRALVDQYFPPSNPRSPQENPFPLPGLSFTVSIAADKWQKDGCAHRFQLVGSTVKLTAIVQSLQSTFPVQSTSFQWALPATGTNESVQVTLSTPGTVNVGVSVTVKTAVTQLTQQHTLAVQVLTPNEATLAAMWCKLLSETLPIPQRVPIGDPALGDLTWIRVIHSNEELTQMEKSLVSTVRVAQSLSSQIAKVIQDRSGSSDSA